MKGALAREDRESLENIVAQARAGGREAFDELIRRFEKNVMKMRDVGVATSFTIGDGETIVMGASQIREEAKDQGAAIITVVTARVLD